MNSDLIANLLLTPGVELEGVELDIAQWVSFAKNRFNQRRFCVVRKWMLIDVMLGDPQLKQLVDSGYSPTLLYASEIAYDSFTGGPLPGAFRSGYQRRHKGHSFESDQTVFLLAGPGCRKHASVPAIQALDAA